MSTEDHDFIDIMELELHDLDARMRALSAYIKDKGDALETEARTLLTHQYHYMVGYKAILAQRLHLEHLK